MKLDAEIKRNVLGRRIVAFLIDHLVLMLVGGTLGVFLMIKFDNTTTKLELAIYAALAVSLITLPYFFKDIIKGKSIGKRIMGLQVRLGSDRTKVPSVWRLVFRNITTFMWPIEVIVLTFNKEGKKIGDMLCNTEVVIEDQAKIQPVGVKD